MPDKVAPLWAAASRTERRTAPPASPNLTQFFEHWRILENPFRGEEARNDAVFARMAGLAGGDPAAAALHSDFDKVLGDPARPSTSIVFGEKGSGKTAMRLQIEARLARHGRENPSQRSFVVLYDELNGFLDRLQERTAGRGDASRRARGTRRAGSHEADPADVFRRIRLVDHIDAIPSIAVTRLVSGILRRPRAGDEVGLAGRIRGLDRSRARSAAPAPTTRTTTAMSGRAGCGGCCTCRRRGG